MRFAVQSKAVMTITASLSVFFILPGLLRGAKFSELTRGAAPELAAPTCRDADQGTLPFVHADWCFTGRMHGPSMLKTRPIVPLGRVHLYPQLQRSLRPPRLS